ncbi:alcohol dehydrogenase zinc-binding domain protein [Phlyctochytrium arcticum]|nr:alcohol dehydrogenase zinc-binding domain protein [Phlyctochytrium arcticum]
MATYKAAAFAAYGGEDQLHLIDVPKPDAPKATEVLIKVHAASINPIDWKVASGALKMLIKDTFPLRTGYDVSGVVEAVGPQVSSFKVGDEVYGRVEETTKGTIAEYVLTVEAHIALKPKTLTHVQAAGIPLAGLTAYQVIERSNFKSRPDGSRKFLVLAGAGGVGHFAIQLAHVAFNAEVVATTASAAKHETVKSLGADVVVDYKTEKIADKIQEYDMAFDTMGEASSLMEVIKPGGIVYSIATLPDSEETNTKFGKVGWMTGKLLDLMTVKYRWAASKKKQDYKYIFMSPDGKELAELATLVDNGKLKVLVDKVFPFTEQGVRDAFTRQKEGRAVGKVIIQVI